MTDRQILDEVYNRLCNMLEANNNTTGRALKSFIEQEWMKQDDKYNHSFHHLDVQEMERHRGLEIGEDGTVKELK